MQWLIFTFLTTMVALGIRKMTREAHEALRGFEEGRFNTYRRPHAPPKPEARPVAQDMVQCPACKSYVVKGTRCCT